ncbi:uncharacterized protein SPPG_03517 [Spizellomyces punctatus DAOM BR117]|uniref:RRM domain-containing protein n=1 Tax=Spizellomyces punctatus (strain DAOM BR117) TaxID=645134 RepID=A0A0L0HLN9_SPIPD|nr:uncharacterized protein SPPG_03517 [Spizellomyces punctatus DAOM BR117]KND01724.1 hypothetical protein SPPG_03517 [Spizellomyces punctatus DAOM BR117]|eukprot:XP_016609763.1 hypothetical protein SPPG_03517 [Spizellomyces punctatus DAOM BR117]
MQQAPDLLMTTEPSDPGQSSLLVRNVPLDELPVGKDITDFFVRFGAKDVRVLRGGKMRNCAFVRFPSSAEASAASSRLRRISLFGRKLKVEYAQALDGSAQEEAKCASSNTAPAPVTIAPQLGINWSSSPNLVYRYPSPTPDILRNIMRSIAAVPKLYTQVLHLMNKMNLPPPFEHVAKESSKKLGHSQQYLRVSTIQGKKRPRDELLASDESELDSEEDVRPIKIKRSAMEGPALQQHMKHAPSMELVTPTPPILPVAHRVPFQSSVTVGASAHQWNFSVQPLPPGMTRSALPVPLLANSGPKIYSPRRPVPPPLLNSPPGPPLTFNRHPVTMSSAMVLRPPSHRSPPVTESANRESVPASKGNEMPTVHQDVISLVELQTHRLSITDLMKIPSFSKYTRGDPSPVLYVKNLNHKKVSEADLRRIFGRFHTSQDIESLDIKLMKEGRMKGQAFVRYTSTDAATEALDSIHGFVLHDKPMVIQYGRSGITEHHSR